MTRTLRPGEVTDVDEVASDGPAAGKKTLTAMLPPPRGGGASDDPQAFPELTAMAQDRGRERDGGAPDRPRPEPPPPPLLAPRGPRTADAPSDPPGSVAAPAAFVDDPFALHTPSGARGPERPAPSPRARAPRPIGGGPTESEPEDDELA